MGLRKEEHREEQYTYRWDADGLCWNARDADGIVIGMPDHFESSEGQRRPQVQ